MVMVDVVGIHCGHHWGGNDCHCSHCCCVCDGDVMNVIC